MKLFDTTLTRLQESLDVRLVEHNVLAGNIANSDTPGYRPKELDFSQAMAAAHAGRRHRRPGGTDARHLGPNGRSGGAARASRATRWSRRPPWCTMARAPAPASTATRSISIAPWRVWPRIRLQYGASARAAGKKLAILRYVVSDGA
jgi:hypothetical protein